MIFLKKMAAFVFVIFVFWYGGVDFDARSPMGAVGFLLACVIFFADSEYFGE